MFGPQVLEEVGRLGYARTGKQQSDKCIAAEAYQSCLVIVIGNQRSREEEDGVDGGTHQDVEPEYGIVVAVLGFLLVDEGRRETAVLQGGGYQREDGDHGDETVIRR